MAFETLVNRINHAIYELKERYGLIVTNSPSGDFVVAYFEADPEKITAVEAHNKTELVFTLLYNCEKAEEIKMRQALS